MTETLPKVNRDLFKAIRDKLTAFPELHNNCSWEVPASADGECGTTRCIAGWAIWMQDPGTHNIGEIREQLGYTSFSGAGRDLLGLTGEEAEYLFYVDNEEAMEMVSHYAEHGREGWVYPEYDDEGKPIHPEE